MKNYCKEFWLKDIHITVGTHWRDWSLLLRIRWSKWISSPERSSFCSTDIFIDILCFTVLIEMFNKGEK